MSFIEDSSPGLWFPHLSLLSLRLPRLSELMDLIAPRSHLREAHNSLVVISQTRHGLPGELGLSGRKSVCRDRSPRPAAGVGSISSSHLSLVLPLPHSYPLLLTGKDSLVLSCRGLRQAGVLGCLRDCSGTAE